MFGPASAASPSAAFHRCFTGSASYIPSQPLSSRHLATRQARQPVRPPAGGACCCWGCRHEGGRPRGAAECRCEKATASQPARQPPGRHSPACGRGGAAARAALSPPLRPGPGGGAATSPQQQPAPAVAAPRVQQVARQRAPRRRKPGKRRREAEVARAKLKRTRRRRISARIYCSDRASGTRRPDCAVTTDTTAQLRLCPAYLQKRTSNGTSVTKECSMPLGAANMLAARCKGKSAIQWPCAQRPAPSAVQRLRASCARRRRTDEQRRGEGGVIVARESSPTAQFPHRQQHLSRQCTP